MDLGQADPPIIHLLRGDKDFPDFSKYMDKGGKIACSRDLSMYLLEKKSVATVSGDAFGGEGHIRFSYAASEDDLRRAMDFVEETLNEV